MSPTPTSTPGHQHGDQRRHWLWMIVCCLAPLALLLLLPLLGVQLTGLLAYAPALVCAGLMLRMMVGMHRGDGPKVAAPKADSSMPNEQE